MRYASLSCTHCARFNNEVFPAFKAKYIDTGKVAYALRNSLRHLSRSPSLASC